MTLEEEEREISKLLKKKVVKRCKRNKNGEILLEFECGARLFVNSSERLDVSITGCEQ